MTQQWGLRDNGACGVAGTQVREFDAGGQPEGCVADDVLAKFYIGEEAVGIWKYGAEPGDGSARTQVDKTGTGGNLVADVEGMSIYYVSDGTGYLIVSSQGNGPFCVYAREGTNPFIFKFAVGSNGTIDAVSGTDGLDVTNVVEAAAGTDPDDRTSFPAVAAGGGGGGDGCGATGVEVVALLIFYDMFRRRRS